MTNATITDVPFEEASAGLDRKLSVAPMMDWSDDLRNVLRNKALP